MIPSFKAERGAKRRKSLAAQGIRGHVHIRK
jgi:hypothetical protein